MPDACSTTSVSRRNSKKAADVAVTLDVTPQVPHLFQAFSAVLDEGDAALSRVEAFLHSQLGSNTRSGR
jgi:hypothetical protein